MIRCKLISPTNVLLERPMFQPLKELEFFLVGIREHKRDRIWHFLFGLVVGLGLAVAIAVLKKIQ